MFPFKNILFPTDFTPHARAALKYAAAFAREGQGRVVLFSVQEGSVPANLLTLPERVCAVNVSTASWVLSPISARNNVPKVVQNAVHFNIILVIGSQRHREGPVEISRRQARKGAAAGRGSRKRFASLPGRGIGAASPIRGGNARLINPPGW